MDKNIFTPSENTDTHKENIKEDFTKLRDDAKDILDRLKRAGSEAGHMISENTKQALEKFTKEGSQHTKEYVDCVESYIKDKPIRSALMAFGAGVVIAKVLGSWTSSR
jgi:ElaB/YqjD/DUF883 family membrane-anchored ribosome-binding protein